ncbi:MAG: phytanoyl-CoA dioxygenase family protein, partial [Anaerolineae bacterium]|nr:phytanoyl-CoA dioxygenase family protein [Anaerolineae bacterium]
MPGGARAGGLSGPARGARGALRSPSDPFQTLDFRVGSEQRAHPDTVHFNSYPPRFLAGVWVALEDVGEDNGTLFYYPGSHKLPEAGFAELGLRVLNHNRAGALETFTYQDYDRFEDYVEDLVTGH